MVDSHSNHNIAAGADYKVGQDLYAASVKDMQNWRELLRQDIVRLEAAIQKKQQERAAADSFFKKPE